jgi:hypothetical protein
MNCGFCVEVNANGSQAMAIQLDNYEDHQLQYNSIHALADLYHVDESRLRKLYESKMKELSGGAKITSFLPVLAERYIKDILRVTVDSL